MPYVSDAQRRFFHSPGAKKAGITSSEVSEFDSASKGMKLPSRKKKKAKIVVNNKMKAYGQMDPKTNKVEINVAKHKGDKTELANSIHHELLHVKHPSMSEKDVANKADRDTIQMSPAEKNALVAKVRGKKLHYKQGAMKRKFKLGRMEAKPGTFIDQMNEIKKKDYKSNNQSLSKRDLSIRGLI